MGSLTNEQKQLIFDYCLGLADEVESAQGLKLISEIDEAAKIYSDLQETLLPLDSLEVEACPAELVESTMRIINTASGVTSQSERLRQLLTAEGRKVATTSYSFWRSFGQLAAIAAGILLVAGVIFPPLHSARQKDWQMRCQAQLGRIAQGIELYRGDHNGVLPAVDMAIGSPWWKVGSQGSENQSNTRHLWLLVKNDYVRPKDFVCPGRSGGRAIQLTGDLVSNLSDFPDRRYVTYSFTVMSRDNMPRADAVMPILMSDVNPIFDKLPADYSKGFNCCMDEKMQRINSRNHRRRGQNVMCGDGSINFMKNRQIGLARDDIFTLRNTKVYNGTETPDSLEDIFLAP